MGIIITLLTGCVSKIKYVQLQENNSSLQKQLDTVLIDNEEKLNRIKQLENELNSILQTNGISPNIAISNAILNLPPQVIELEKNCEFTKTNFTQIGDNIIEEFKKNPINAVLRKSEKINGSAKRWILVSTGYSKILKTNPRYETIVYFINLYSDKPNNKYVIVVDFVPLISSSPSDKKSFFYSENQKNLYFSVLNDKMDSIMDNLKLFNNCLKNRP